MKDLQSFPAALAEPAERNAFIGKVYLLLIASLLAGAGTAALGVYNHISADWFLPGVLLEFILLFYAYKVRHERGYNLFALFAFVASTGLVLATVLGSVIAKGMGGLILPAAGLALGLFALLSAYVLISGRDFSFLGGFLFICLLTLLAGWIFMAFFPAAAPFSKLALAAAGVVIFSGYVLFDTSLMMHHLGTGDYVAATISLYLDVLNLFTDFLRILMETGGALWDSISILDFFSIDL